LVHNLLLADVIFILPAYSSIQVQLWKKVKVENEVTKHGLMKNLVGKSLTWTVEKFWKN
jgi:hypothetical protein